MIIWVSAIDFSFDAQGTFKFTVQVTGLYMVYAFIYLYTNATSDTMVMFTRVVAPYGTSPQFANLTLIDGVEVMGIGNSMV